MRAQAHHPKRDECDVAAVRRGEAAALARAVSIALGGGEPGRRLRAALAGRPRGARRVGVAGPAGVGKSSLLRELIRRLRRRGERVALLACDPASAVTGGAVLADRCRLGELMEDAGVFCRSLAHRGAAGEPAPGLETALEVLEAAGFPWIFVETVGTGQMEARAAGPVETQVLVLSPQCGDDFQMLKAGALEVADLVVVNKGDQPGGRAWAALLAETLGVEKDAGGADGEGSGGGKEAGGEPRRSRAPRVLGVSAATGEGVEALLSALVEAGGAGGIVAGAQTQGVTSA